MDAPRFDQCSFWGDSPYWQNAFNSALADLRLNLFGTPTLLVNNRGVGRIDLNRNETIEIEIGVIFVGCGGFH